MADSYQVTLHKTGSGTAVGDWTVTIQRILGTDCAEIFWQYKNRYPWLKLGTNQMDLLPGWSSPIGVHPPCYLCVDASNGEGSNIHEIQAVWWSRVNVEEEDYVVRFRKGSSGDWSSWSTDTITTEGATFATQLDEILGSGNYISRNHDQSELEYTEGYDGFHYHHGVLTIEYYGNNTHELVEMQFKGFSTGTIVTDGLPATSSQRLQTGGGLTKHEFQVVHINEADAPYTLTFNGNTTASIAYGDSYSTIETELNTAASPDYTVTVHGNSGLGSHVYIVEFLANEDVPLMTSDYATVELVANGGEVPA